MILNTGRSAGRMIAYVSIVFGVTTGKL